MYVIYNEQHSNHQPIGELCDGELTPHHERAKRLENVYAYLKQENYEFLPAEQFSEEYIKQTHSSDYLNFLENNKNTFPSVFEYFFDTYTPFNKKTLAAAKESVNCVLTGAKLIKNKKTNYCYIATRPPGHHAMHDKTGGYCYFNNAGIAANYLGGKVAILDIDVHHGNGTQDVFYDNDQVLTISLHANPDDLFPHFMGYESENNETNYNFTFPPQTHFSQYLPKFQKALDLISEFNPDYLIMAAGFDTYYQDPIGNFEFKLEDYEEMGKMIKELNLPTLITQEGGYNVDHLPRCVDSFLSCFK